MTRAQLRTLAWQWSRTDVATVSEAQIDEWLNEAADSFARDVGGLTQDETIQGDGVTRSFPLPASTADVQAVYYLDGQEWPLTEGDSTNGRPLNVLRDPDFESGAPGDRPYYWAVEQRVPPVLWLDAVLTADARIKAVLSVSTVMFGPLDTDVPVLPVEYHEALALHAAAWAARSQFDEGVAEQRLRQYNRLTARYQQERGSKEPSGMTLAMVPDIMQTAVGFSEERGFSIQASVTSDDIDTYRNVKRILMGAPGVEIDADDHARTLTIHVAGANPMTGLSPSEQRTLRGAVQITSIQQSGRLITFASSGGGTVNVEALQGIEIRDEGQRQGNVEEVEVLDFRGDGVDAKVSGTVATITIPSAADGAVGIEQVHDAVADDIVAGAGLTKTKDDAANTVTLDVETPYTSGERTKLSGIEADATADQTAGEIRDKLQGLTADDRLDATAIKGLLSGGGVDDETIHDFIASDIQAGAGLSKTVDDPGDTVTLSVDNPYPPADEAKLAGIEAGATGDQTAAEIKASYESNTDTNAFTDAEKSKLSSVEDNATGDQTASEIKALYESNANTNAFDDAEQTKLAGIEAGATGDQTASEIKALYESNANTNAFDDAEQTKLAGIAAGAQVNPPAARLLPTPLGSAGQVPKVASGGTTVEWADDEQGSGGGGVSIEEVHDAVADDIQAGTGISKVKDDAANTVTLNVDNPYPTADETKLAGIAAGAQVNPPAARLLPTPLGSAGQVPKVASGGTTVEWADDEQGSGGGISRAEALYHVNVAPAISGFTVGDMVDVDGILHVLASSVANGTLHGTAARIDSNYLGVIVIPNATHQGSWSDPAIRAEFTWAPTAEGVALARLRLLRSGFTGAPPANLYVQAQTKQDFTDLFFTRDTGRDTGSGQGGSATGVYAWRTETTGARIGSTEVGEKFQINIATNSFGGTPLEIHEAARWEPVAAASASDNQDIAEIARDAVGKALSDGSGDLTFTVDDADDEIDAVIKDGVIEPGNLDDDTAAKKRAFRDAIEADALIAGTNITIGAPNAEGKRVIAAAAGGGGGGGGGSGFTRSASPAANVDVAATTPASPANTEGGESAWVTIATLTAITDAEIGPIALSAELDGELQENSLGGGGDRVFTSFQIMRTRSAANTVLSDSSAYGPRNLPSAGNTGSKYAERSHHVAETLTAFDTAVAGDVYFVQAKVFSQRTTAGDVRTLRFTPDQNSLQILGTGESGAQSAEDTFGNPPVDPAHEFKIQAVQHTDPHIVRLDYDGSRGAVQYRGTFPITDDGSVTGRLEYTRVGTTGTNPGRFYITTFGSRAATATLANLFATGTVDGISVKVGATPAAAEAAEATVIPITRDTGFTASLAFQSTTALTTDISPMATADTVYVEINFRFARVEGLIGWTRNAAAEISEPTIRAAMSNATNEFIQGAVDVDHGLVAILGRSPAGTFLYVIDSAGNRSGSPYTVPVSTGAFVGGLAYDASTKKLYYVETSSNFQPSIRVLQLTFSGGAFSGASPVSGDTIPWSTLSGLGWSSGRPPNAVAFIGGRLYIIDPGGTGRVFSGGTVDRTRDFTLPDPAQVQGSPPFPGGAFGFRAGRYIAYSESGRDLSFWDTSAAAPAPDLVLTRATLNMVAANLNPYGGYLTSTNRLHLFGQERQNGVFDGVEHPILYAYPDGEWHFRTLDSDRIKAEAREAHVRSITPGDGALAVTTVAEDGTATEATVPFGTPPGRNTFPTAPTTGERVLLLQRQVIPGFGVLVAGQQQDQTGYFGSIGSLTGAPANGIGALTSYAQAYSGSSAAALRDKTIWQRVGTEARTPASVRIGAQTYTVSPVSGLNHFYELSGADGSTLEVSSEYEVQFFYSNGDQVYADMPKDPDDYTYDGHFWLITPGVLTQPRDLRLDAADTVQTGRIVAVDPSDAGEFKLIRGLTSLYDAPTIGHAITSVNSASREPFTLIAPTFDLDDFADGLVMAEVEITRGTASSGLGLGAGAGAAYRQVGFATTGALRRQVVYSAGGVIEGIEMASVGVFQGAAQRGTVSLWLARNAQNQVGYVWDYAVGGGSASGNINIGGRLTLIFQPFL